MLRNFKFSPVATLTAVLLAAVMLRCSYWQWERYLQKKELVESYRGHSSSTPLPLPQTEEELAKTINRKVVAKGRYDFTRQMLIANRRHASGPGYWLITPFLPENSNTSILVSRGFIPYAEGNSGKLDQYNFNSEEELQAVLKEGVAPKSFLGCTGPKSAKKAKNSNFTQTWFYPEVDSMAAQLPYPVERLYYVQRLGPPPHGEFPAEAVSIEVPPSTHFGYFIEWILLALATLAAAITYQLWPKRNRAERDPSTALMH
jgi:surfeit locus 1 family protein